MSALLSEPSVLPSFAYNKPRSFDSSLFVVAFLNTFMPPLFFSPFFLCVETHFLLVVPSLRGQDQKSPPNQFHFFFLNSRPPIERQKRPREISQSDRFFMAGHLECIHYAFAISSKISIKDFRFFRYRQHSLQLKLDFNFNLISICFLLQLIEIDLEIDF